MRQRFGKRADLPGNPVFDIGEKIGLGTHHPPPVHKGRMRAFG
jgi:hypothetical protein